MPFLHKNILNIFLLQEEPENNVSRGTIISPEKAGPSRWRQSNENCRKKYKSRMKRNLGYSYTSSRGKNIQPRTLGAQCSCKMNCRAKLQGREELIFHSFWELASYEKQNTYLFSSITSIPKKRSYKKKTKRQNSSRKLTFFYKVKINGVDVQVCKNEFLAVHGLQNSQKRVRNITAQISEGRSTAKPDTRGKHRNRPNKISEERIQSVFEHIESIPKYVSHYSREKNPDRVYLDHDINISILYKDFYMTWCQEKNIEPVKEDRYRRIFCSKFNIGFKLPKVDTCATCDELNNLIEANKEIKAIYQDLKIKLELHQRRAAAMQNDLKRETEDAKRNHKKIVISFDLQQTLPTPLLTVGQAFYLRKAWTYNLGVHNCGDGQATMYMWTEDVAKRGSEEIASCLLNYLTSRLTTGEEDLILYTDNCGGQNKNWLLMLLWLQLVREKKYKTIEHRFLVSGHTYLPSDRDFAVIERHKKYLRQVYCPQQWYEAVSRSKRVNPFNVVVMKQENFLSFQNIPFSKKNVTEDREPIKFTQIRCFKFDYNFPNTMFIKHLQNEVSFKTVNIGKRGIHISEINNVLQNLPIKYQQRLKLSAEKIADLKKLLKYIPPVFQQYFLELTENSEDEPVRIRILEAENIDGELEDLPIDDGLVGD